MRLPALPPLPPLPPRSSFPSLPSSLPSLPTSLPSLPHLPRTWAEVTANPETMRRIMNAWPPFVGAGIHVTEIAPDFSQAKVLLRLRPWTANYVGTQYGGSMFSMTDAFWMILVSNRLGPDYVLWDKRAEIEFRRPGRSDLHTTFDVTDDLIEELRAAADSGEKVLRWLENDIMDHEGHVVAHVRRQLYVRRKRPGQD